MKNAEFPGNFILLRTLKRYSIRNQDDKAEFSSKHFNFLFCKKRVSFELYFSDMFTKLKFPFNFDAARLKDDLRKFLPADWTPHFNTAYYEGDWSGIALRASKDAALQLYPDPVSDSYENTEMLARCSYIPEVINAFKCELETVRFLKLAAGAKILEHRDFKLGFEDGVVRVHIPVQTNPQVEFFLNGGLLTMREGEAWYLNFNLPHSVNNRGLNDRVHLVLDCILNDWLRDFSTAEI